MNFDRYRFKMVQFWFSPCVSVRRILPVEI